LVFWIDDDETADECWVADIRAAFRDHPDASAVSGSVLPAELETWPQWWFEQYGGHTKGRGFTAEKFGPGFNQSPMYPLPPFGVGANMAFRVEPLKSIGFDPGLGAGTPTSGGEDTLIFSQLLLQGHTVVFEPAASTRHYHRRGYDELEKQMYGYGVGLTAYYAALLRWNWRLVVPLLGLLPRALVDLSGRRNSQMAANLPADFPSELIRMKRGAMVRGPIAYARARRQARKARTVA
jgi:hypothetical protein